MPYKNDADRFANRRLKRPFVRLRQWAERGFEFDMDSQCITCHYCGRTTRYNGPPKNRHWLDCKHPEEVSRELHGSTVCSI